MVKSGEPIAEMAMTGMARVRGSCLSLIVASRPATDDSSPRAPLTEARRPAGLAATLVFGVAFGWVEAAVVVYLRRLFYPDGFGFPLRDFPLEIGVVEVAREFATLVMLVAVAWLGARTAWGRFCMPGSRRPTCSRPSR